MRFRRLLSIALLFVPGTLYSVEAMRPLPAAMTSRLDATPDFMQTDPEGAFPDRGSVYCAPVSVSNSLVWLAHNGFPKLEPHGGSPKQRQIALIRTLARLMGTNKADNGTGTAELINGLHEYVTECGYACRRLEYEGWRRIPRGTKRSTTVPEIDWIKAGLCESTGAVWLNVGWYRYHRDRNEFVRFGGHWLTLVGYGIDEHGRPDPRCLIIHDPSPRSGNGMAHDVIRLEPIVTGRLVTDAKSGAGHSAIGYHKVHSRVRLPKGTDFAILDGAVVMTLQPPAH